MFIFLPRFYDWVAQLVEQRIEAPCVGGSIPSSLIPGNLGMSVYD